MIPYHPFIAAVLPLLLLLSANAEEASPSSVLRSAGIAIGLVAILWALQAVVLRSVSAAAAPTTLIWLFCATLMPAHRAVSSLLSLEGFSHRVVGGVSVAVVWFFLVALIMRQLRLKPDQKGVNQALNLVLICLAIVPVANIVRVGLSERQEATVVSPPQVGSLEARNPLDVYYIIPDAYARMDVLREVYGYDNSEFLGQLEDLGFVVADSSVANYAQTALSLPSSLNMSYLFPPGGDPNSTSRRAAHNALRRNAVMSSFSEAGYAIIAPGSGYGFAEIPSADVHHNSGLNEFENVAAYTFLGALWPPLHDRLPGRARVSHYSRVTEMLSQLGTERRANQPVFVFAHFIAPHPPFVFDADGTERTDKNPIEQLDGSYSVSDYVRQLRGVNVHLLQAVKRIMTASDEPCIIIIQSDHGPGLGLRRENPLETDMRERLGILNAYLVPEEVQDSLYPEITPVNSFRLILNYCLGTSIPLIEDRAFFSSGSRPYNFIDVTEEVRGQLDRPLPDSH